MDMGTIFIPVNGMEHPILKLKKEKKQRRILALGPNLKKDNKYGRFLEWGSITYERKPGVIQTLGGATQRRTPYSGIYVIK